MTTIDRQQAFSGTTASDIDATALEAYLALHVAGFAGPLAIARFKGGQSNPTYKLTTPLHSYVLRRKPFGKLLPSAHAIEREHRCIDAVARHHLLGLGGERRRLGFEVGALGLSKQSADGPQHLGVDHRAHELDELVRLRLGIVRHHAPPQRRSIDLRRLLG